MKSLFFSEKCWCIISTFTVFVIDIIAPLGVATDVLYICCILIVFGQTKRTILLSGFAATSLIILTLLIFDALSKINYVTLFNHAISILAVLITSYIAIRYQKGNEHHRMIEQKHIADMQQMLFITSHKVRRPVANIIGLLSIGSADISNMKPDEITDLFSKLQFSSNEVDDLLRELNLYIESVKNDDVN